MEVSEKLDAYIRNVKAEKKHLEIVKKKCLEELKEANNFLSAGEGVLNFFLNQLAKEREEDLLFLLNNNEKIDFGKGCFYAPYEREGFVHADKISLEPSLYTGYESCLLVTGEDVDERNYWLGHISLLMLDCDLTFLKEEVRNKEAAQKKAYEKKLFEELKIKLGE